MVSGLRGRNYDEKINKLGEAHNPGETEVAGVHVTGVKNPGRTRQCVIKVLF
jgi:hypothetical protein